VWPPPQPLPAHFMSEPERTSAFCNLIHDKSTNLACTYLPHQGAPGSAGSSLFLPEGAVGVFDLPSSWAVVQSQGGLTGKQALIDT